MSDLAIATLLGLVQGLTEFLPVSSTAHLVIAEKLFHLDPERFGLTFDVAVHLGTALAVLLYFAGTWIGLVRDVFSGRWRLPLLVVVGTLPAAIAGVLFQSAVEDQLRDVRVVAAALVIGSLVFLAAERMATQRVDLARIGWGTAIFMGAAQAIALIPGVSRSGITISAGLAAGVQRIDATRLSFLLATPVIIGASAKTLLDARDASGLLAEPQLAVAGFIVSFVSGFSAVAFLVRFLRAHSLNWFIPYRLLLAAALLLAAFLGVA
ncbi:MAG: undecaprenyl-diphosphate phosphatase [Chloroflexi bacterium]|nr:undecaprenyl-diphosphate phosphatase [Chloroflexota bacterium]